MKEIVVEGIKNIKDYLQEFDKYDCVVIISKYNSGKSSIATDLIHEHFGESYTYYVTFIDQSKPNFVPRESRLKLGEVISGKKIVFDEIDDDQDRDVKSYVKKLIENNLVIILSNPYASSDEAEKEIDLFKEHEKEILPDNTLFLFVKKKRT